MANFIITDGAVAQLRKAAKRLFTENRMDGDEMRDMAQLLMGICDEVAHLEVTDYEMEQLFNSPEME